MSCLLGALNQQLLFVSSTTVYTSPAAIGASPASINPTIQLPPITLSDKEADDILNSLSYHPEDTNFSLETSESIIDPEPEPNLNSVVKKVPEDIQTKVWLVLGS